MTFININTTHFKHTHIWVKKHGPDMETNSIIVFYYVVSFEHVV